MAQALAGSHPPWDSFQWSFICRKMETTAPLARVGNCGNKRMAEPRSWGKQEGSLLSAVGQLLLLSRGSPQRSSWNRQCEQEARGADSLFLYFNGLFIVSKREKESKEFPTRSGSLPLTACFSDIFPLLLPFSGMSVCSGCTHAHTSPDRPSGQTVAVSAVFAHCSAVDVCVLCHAGQLHPVLGEPWVPVLHAPPYLLALGGGVCPICYLLDFFLVRFAF